jgi:spore germination cell wall hydrolase CwlJ-like protein
MRRTTLRDFVNASFALALASTLGGCLGDSTGGRPETAIVTGNVTERDCLVRAMYFESNRSSRDGLMAVGTVVMNRVDSPRFPNSICQVVGQGRQFAPGVLTRPLDPAQVRPAEQAADAILKGERYAPIGIAMHFHMASFQNPYPAQYVAVAGGNAFYLKKRRLFREQAIASKAPPVITASAAGPATASPAVTAANTPASDGGVLQKLYSLASTSQPAAAGCATVSAGFGGTSLACEDEAAGR